LEPTDSPGCIQPGRRDVWDGTALKDGVRTTDLARRYREGKRDADRFEKPLANSFASAIPYSRSSPSLPLFGTQTVIVINSFGPSSAQIVTWRLLWIDVPTWPSFKWVIFMSSPGYEKERPVRTLSLQESLFFSHRGPKWIGNSRSWAAAHFQLLGKSPVETGLE
jgi:hypothetical protein